MANAEPRMDESPITVERAVPVPALAAYRSVLARYELARLRGIAGAVGRADTAPPSAQVLAGQVAEHLEFPRTLDTILGRLTHDERMALGLFARCEAPAWPVAGLSLALRCLG